MSRIHQALQKARAQQTDTEPELPNVEEIVAGEDASPAVEAHTGQSIKQAADEMLSMLTGASETPATTVDLDQFPFAGCTRHNWNLRTEELVFLKDDGPQFGREEFRTLRSRLYQIRGTDSSAVLVVTSAVPHEGKSFTAANLAHAFALQSGLRTLVIDADLRRTSGSTALFNAPSSPGLSEYLMGEHTLSEVVQTGPIENLYLIPCGRSVANPGELISPAKISALLTALRPNFGWIVIDTPPVLPVVDARLITDFADGVLFVVNSRSTQAALVKKAIREFRRESILGVVLNGVDPKVNLYYSHYGTAYESASGGKDSPQPPARRTTLQ